MPDRTTHRLLVAAAAFTGVAAAYGGLVRTHAGQQADDGLARATSARRPVRRVADVALRPYGRAAYATAATALGVVGLATRGPVRTACGSTALLATLAQVEYLKHALPRPPLGPRPALDGAANSYPSGHTAGVAALAAMGVVLAPQRARGLTAVGTGATALVGAATVAARWHRPSDVLGAGLTATAWGALGLAAAEALDPL